MLVVSNIRLEHIGSFSVLKQPHSTEDSAQQS